jgi:hypothetical protein
MPGPEQPPCQEQISKIAGNHAGFSTAAQFQAMCGARRRTPCPCGLMVLVDVGLTRKPYSHVQRWNTM